MRQAGRVVSALALVAVLGLGSAAYGQGQGAGQPAGVGQELIDVIVVMDPAFAPGSHRANRAEAARLARGLGITPRHTYGTALFGFAASVPQDRLVVLENHPMVLHVDLDAEVSIAKPKWCDNPDNAGHPACKDDEPPPDEEPPADDEPPPAEGTAVVPWGVDRIGAGNLNPNTGAGIPVYIIDTGIKVGHGDLNVVDGFAVETCKGGGCQKPWDDDNGHGTHVAGTAGANGKTIVGVAPGVDLYAVKVLAKNGMGSRSGVIAGIDWVAQQVQASGEPAVANMSLGGSGSKSGTCAASGFSGSDSYHRAICNAARKGVVFAVAAGNSGADAANAVPAAYDDAVITVSATNDKDDWPSWSNWGNKEADWTNNKSAPVAIAAPGVDILSTWNNGGTRTTSGTSMAAPHVAGAVALFLKSSPQSASFSAFQNARAKLLQEAEDTQGAFTNTSGRPHAEDFLDASGF